MSSLSEHVQITVTLNDVGVARASFGVPMVLSYTAAWVERAREYEGITDVAADFAAGTPEYLAANAIFSQSPHPDKIIIGRAANKPTQQYTVGAASAQNADAYQINLTQVGATVTNPLTYTSDSTATIQEINNGLLTALNGVAGKNYTATFSPLTFTSQNFTVLDQPTGKLTDTAHGLNTGDGPFQLTTTSALPTGLTTLTNYWVIRFDANTIQLATSLANALAGTAIVLSSNGTGTQTINGNTPLSPILPFLVTANAAGNYFSLEVLDTQLMSIKQTHADPGIAADLTAVQLQNDDWYALVTTHNSKSVVVAAAAYIEAVTKLYFPCVNETDALNVAYTGVETDTLATLRSSGYLRTAPCYYPSPAKMFAAAWVGRVLPIDPGGDDWKFKTLAGLSGIVSTATQRTNLRARKGNTYETIKSRSMTWEGTVCSGDFIDNVRGKDFIVDDMQSRVFAVLGTPNKTPYTDNGIAVIESEVRASLKNAAKQGIIVASSIVVTVPDASAVSTNDKATRTLRNVNWSCEFQGAIHDVSITGTISA